MRSKRIKAVAVILLVFALNIIRISAGHAEDNNMSFQSLQVAAEQGDAAAQYNLGRVYEQGRGVTQNEIEATKWFQKSAAQGYAEAESKLAKRYEYGIFGVPKDKAQAEKLYHQAAEQGDPLAKFSLFLMKYPDLSFVIIIGTPTIWILINTVWLLLVTMAVLRFRPPFKMALKAGFISSMFYPVYCILGAANPEFHIVFIVFLTIISCSIFEKIIKHPQTGSIGRQKGGLIFVGSLLGQIVLSLF